MTAARDLLASLRIPAIGAPMTGASSVELVVAGCRAGILGAIPATNASSPEELASWLGRIDDELGEGDAPYAVNFPLYSSQTRRREDLEIALGSRTELIIASAGSPGALVEPTHAAGKQIYSDVATMRHAESALRHGVDGLILLTAGAGGITGWMNPFVFVRGVREVYDGPMVLAGGVADGVALAAAIRLGCDAAYLGTALIPALESCAPDDFREAVLAASMDDVTINLMPTGLNANGVAPDEVGPRDGGRMFSMGHTAHAVRDALPVAEIVDRIATEFAAAGTVGAAR